MDISQKATLTAIKDWLYERGPCDSQSPLFVSRLYNTLSTQSVRLLIKNLVSLTQIKERITPHTFRHTYATLLLEGGVDITYIQHLLGHSSVVTTQIYTYVNLQKQHEILSKKHQREIHLTDLFHVCSRMRWQAIAYGR
ncbi:MAG: tyrosine-type recombinase/integrase [Bacteroidaceae bacterium]|nr:tyrosine-type recombinase/integrase [Bacteroidaceae bacterium]